jgi:hypothetical protein
MRAHLTTAVAVLCAGLCAAPGQAATVYIATTDSGGGTTGQTAALNSAISSAIQVANSYGFAGVRLDKAFDPLNPLDLCTNDRPARPQGVRGQGPGQPPSTNDAAVPKMGDANATLQPGDVLLVLAVTRADQAFNKFTGAFTNDVLLNLTQINCPPDKPRDAAGGANAQSLAGSVVSNGWNGATQGALIEHYNQNPVAGIGSVAALLTSPWINKYRLWLNVPITFLDSFKHEKGSLDGTIYCATAAAMLDMLYENGRIKIDSDKYGRRAYRRGESDKTWYRVPGVNYCHQPQPDRPKLDEPQTLNG